MDFSAGDIILAGRLERHVCRCHCYQSLSYRTYRRLCITPVCLVGKYHWSTVKSLKLDSLNIIVSFSFCRWDQLKNKRINIFMQMWMKEHTHTNCLLWINLVISSTQFFGSSKFQVKVKYIKSCRLISSFWTYRCICVVLFNFSFLV